MPNHVHNARLLVRVNIKCPMHINSEAEFVIVKKGCITAVVDGQKRVVRAGECTVIFPYQLHEFLPDEYTQAHVLMFPQCCVNEFCSAYADLIPDKSVFLLDEACLNYIYSVISYAENSIDSVVIQSVLYPLAAQYIKNTEFSDKPNQSDNSLQSIINYMYQHMSEPINMQMLTKEFGMSAMTMNKLFEKSIHMKPIALLNNIRIESACTYLNHADYNITETAYLCGYGSLRTFNRAFQKVMKCTPTEFRRSLTGMDKN